mmetsp:Transcript_35576/g.74059  ORF Transcript_35576/g.74059 Transcript_35576/m.74059 type:complete len:147 (+) Transcript_35576:358-798(+)
MQPTSFGNKPWQQSKTPSILRPHYPERWHNQRVALMGAKNWQTRNNRIILKLMFDVRIWTNHDYGFEFDTTLETFAHKSCSLYVSLVILIYRLCCPCSLDHRGNGRELKQLHVKNQIFPHVRNQRPSCLQDICRDPQIGIAVPYLY